MGLRRRQRGLGCRAHAHLHEPRQLYGDADGVRRTRTVRHRHRADQRREQPARADHRRAPRPARSTATGRPLTAERRAPATTEHGSAPRLAHSTGTWPHPCTRDHEHPHGEPAPAPSSSTCTPLQRPRRRLPLRHRSHRDRRPRRHGFDRDGSRIHPETVTLQPAQRAGRRAALLRRRRASRAPWDRGLGDRVPGRRSARPRASTVGGRRPGDSRPLVERRQSRAHDADRAGRGHDPHGDLPRPRPRRWSRTPTRTQVPHPIPTLSRSRTASAPGSRQASRADDSSSTASWRTRPASLPWSSRWHISAAGAAAGWQARRSACAPGPPASRADGWPRASLEADGRSPCRGAWRWAPIVSGCARRTASATSAGTPWTGAASCGSRSQRARLVAAC